MARGALVLLLGFAFQVVSAQTPIWQTSFDSMSPPTLRRFPSHIQFDANGDLLLDTLTYTGPTNQLLRMGVTGELRWQATVPPWLADMNVNVLPSPDGGAYVADAYYSWLIRLDSNGSLRWRRGVPADLLVALSNGQIASASCRVLSILDGETGSIERQASLPWSGSRCGVTGMRVDSKGELIIVARKDRWNPSDESRVVKLELDGSQIWEHLESSDMTLLGTDGGLVYLSTDTQILALSEVTGEMLWQSSPTSISNAALIGVNPAVPVVIGETQVLGLSAADGTVQWTQSLVAEDASAAVGNALLVRTAAGLVKLDASTGTIAWTTPMPGMDSFGNPIEEWLALGGLSEGHFMAVARAASATSQPPPFVQRIDFLSGSLSGVVPVPAVQQTNGGDATLDGDYIYSISHVQNSVATKFRLNKLNASDGTVIWNSPENSLVNSEARQEFDIVARDGQVLVATPTVDPISASNAYSIWLWNATTGEARWNASLQQAGESWIGAKMQTPVIDSDSNILVSIHGAFSCGKAGTCSRKTISKFNGINGSVLWQRTETTSGSLIEVSLDPDPYHELGSDVVAGQGLGVVRIDGLNGSTVWSAQTGNLLGRIRSLHLASDGNVVAIGSFRWAKLDADTGNLLWWSDLPAVASGCYRWQPAQEFSNGDLFLYCRENVESNPAFAILHPETAVGDVWYPDVNGIYKWNAIEAAVNSKDEIWLRVTEKLSPDTEYVRYLTRFDPTTGQFMGRQLGSSYNYYVDGFMPFISLGGWLAAPENGRLPILSFQVRPQLPVEYGVAVFDTSVNKNGNLSVEVNGCGEPVMPGESCDFAASSTFVGDASTGPVGVDIYLAWGSGASNVTCSSSMTGNFPCDPDQRDGNLHDTIMLSPGETISISGTMTARETGDAQAPKLSVIVHGPFSLSEQVTTDNVAVVLLTQSLFRNGFD